MLRDVLIWIAILIVFLIGFAFALSCVVHATQEETNIPESFKMLFWSIFLIVPDPIPSPEFGILLGCYLVVVVIVLLNLLIGNQTKKLSLNISAVLNNSFSAIIEQATTEWKYSRAEFVRDCALRSAIPAPLNLLELLVMPASLLRWLFKCKKRTSVVSDELEDAEIHSCKDIWTK